MGRLVGRDGAFDAVSSEIAGAATQTRPGLRRRAMRSHSPRMSPSYDAKTDTP